MSRYSRIFVAALRRVKMGMLESSAYDAQFVKILQDSKLGPCTNGAGLTRAFQQQTETQFVSC